MEFTEYLVQLQPFLEIVVGSAFFAAAIEVMKKYLKMTWKTAMVVSSLIIGIAAVSWDTFVQPEMKDAMIRHITQIIAVSTFVFNLIKGK